MEGGRLTSDYGTFFGGKTYCCVQSGKFGNEVVPVEVKTRKGGGQLVDRDEEFTKVDFGKLKALRAVFQKGSYFKDNLQINN
jgi:hypothetical protein